MAMLTEKDELRHAHDNDPRWRESLYWGFVLPDASLGGVVYLRLDPNAKTVSPMILVYRNFGDVAYFFNASDPMPARLELDHVTVQGFRLKGLQPLSTCSVAFDDGAGASLEFSFTGIHPPFDYASNRAGCPSPLAANRFEQAGRFDGVLRLKGDTFPLSGFGQRDHSWGTRDWTAIQHYKWISAQSDDGLAVNLTCSVIRGETAFNGYVYDGTEVSGIVRAHVETAYAPDGATQQAIAAAILDEAGRTTRLQGTVFALTEIPTEQSVLAEAVARFKIDGAPGTGIIEYLWPGYYFEHLKKWKVGGAKP
jgi:hypothetical protein